MSFRHGRLDAGLLATVLPADYAQRSAFVCGPRGFDDEITEALIALGVPARSVPRLRRRNVTATVVNDGLRAASVDIRWTASTEPDGDAITYEVQYIEGDAVSSTKTTATTVRLTLLRGRPYSISVVAIDARGDRSASSATITVTAPPIRVRLVAGIGVRGGLAQACAGVANACVITDLATASVRVRATSTARLTDARVRLLVLWRKPGTTRFVSRPAAIASIATGRASISLAKVVNAAGTWCMRARLAPNSGELVLGRVSLAPTCVSYAPPAEMG